MKFVCVSIFLIPGGVVGEGCRDKEATVSLRQGPYLPGFKYVLTDRGGA